MARPKPLTGAQAKQSSYWTAGQAYTLAIACLVAGLAIGYLFHGSANTSATNVQAASGANSVPTFSQEQLMDKNAEPLLARLRQNPTDSNTMVQLGNMYYDAKLFGRAIGYYENALKLAPNDPNVISDLGTSYFYSGQSDVALQHLNRALQVRTNFSPALFNIGIVKWQGKKDGKGAIEAWQQLLKTNPSYESRQQVEQLIAEVQQSPELGSAR